MLIPHIRISSGYGVFYLNSLMKRKELNSLLEKYNENKIFRAIINAVPYIGGSLDTLMTSDIQKKSMERFENFINLFSKEISEIKQDKLDYNFLKSEEFYDLYIQTLNLVIKTRLREKIRAYSKILASSLITETQNEINPEDIVNIIGNLTETHILWIKEIAKYQKSENPKTINKTIIFKAGTFDKFTKEYSLFGLIGLLNNNLIIRHPATGSAHVAEIYYSTTTVFKTIESFLLDDIPDSSEIFSI